MSSNKNVFDNNIQRVDGLCDLYDLLISDKKTNKNKGHYYTDILRAATVFLHSAFEEYYRGVITAWLPMNGSKEALKVINLPDDAGKNGVKYHLVDLMMYKDKTVKELFQKAVYDYMSRTTFNSYDEICGWASKLGLNISTFTKAKYIEDAVQRRHKIVHEADMDNQSDNNKLRRIKPTDVAKWRNAYSELVALIDAQIVAWESA